MELTPKTTNEKMKRNTFRFAILAAAALTACNDTPDSLYEHEDSVQDVPDIVLESYARPYDIIPEEEWTEINFGKCIAAMGTDDTGSTTLADQRPAHLVKLDTHIRMMKGQRDGRAVREIRRGQPERGEDAQGAFLEMGRPRRQLAQRLPGGRHHLEGRPTLSPAGSEDASRPRPNGNWPPKP